MEIDQGDAFDEELRRRLQELLARLSLQDIAGALGYALAHADTDEHFVLMLAGALEGQALRRKVSIWPIPVQKAEQWYLSGLRQPPGDEQLN